MSTITKNVLNKMNDLFKENYIPTTFEKVEKNGTEADILCTLHSDMGYRDDEIMGEFFFVELPDGSLIFNSVMTLTEEINSEYLIPLFTAILHINPYLEMGSFVTDITDSRLFYKLSIPVSGDLNEEEVYNQVDLCIGNALSICEKYTSMLLDVNEGESTVDEAVALAVNVK